MTAGAAADRPRLGGVVMTRKASWRRNVEFVEARRWTEGDFLLLAGTSTGKSFLKRKPYYFIPCDRNSYRTSVQDR